MHTDARARHLQVERPLIFVQLLQHFDLLVHVAQVLWHTEGIAGPVSLGRAQSGQGIAERGAGQLAGLLAPGRLPR